MNILGRYITGQVVRPMLAIVLVALAALLAERMLRVVDIVIGWRGGLLVLIEMLGYLIPHYMGLALPAAFFIAILVVVSRLSRDGELDAMTAAGFGLNRIIRPLLGVALVLVAINALTLSHLQPYSRYAYRAALFALSNVSFQALLRERVFVTLEGTTFTVDRLSDDRRRVEGLVLFNERPDGSSLIVTARTGEVIPARGTQPLTLELHDGVQQFLPSTKSGEAASGPATATVRFRNFTSDLKGGEPKPFRPRGEDERELTLPELWRALDQPVKGIDPPEIAAEFHGRVVRIVSTLMLPLVAAPLAIARRRAQRSYGIVIGIALLLIYNQTLQFGETLADNDRLSPWLSLWAPFAVFAALGLALTWTRTARVPRGGGAGRFDELVEKLLRRLRRSEPEPARS